MAPYERWRARRLTISRSLYGRIYRLTSNETGYGFPASEELLHGISTSLAINEPEAIARHGRGGYRAEVGAIHA